jgi:putative selenate reductase
MTNSFYPVTLIHLLQIILDEFSGNNSIFGIPEELFFKPEQNRPFVTEIFGHLLDSPLGVAAGPHSQMAQNIIAAWLTGSRYIELKTIQTLDRINVSKPCIDMQDEGYNCEWSQELTIKESFNEYLNAWIIIHILNHKFGLGSKTGTVFNMSAGYNMEGILNSNVQWYFEKMSACGPEIAIKSEEVRSIYPEIDKVLIPGTISDNITLSTMHGCPAEEIEQIAAYFLGKRKLHTLVKLNPTLLGSATVRDILNRKLKFPTVVPDSAFAHDLKYSDALKMIRSLMAIAGNNSRQFGLKLTNTLESVNIKEVFGNDQKMMYMSGRSLHPLAVNLADKLQKEFNGRLLLSFSAGADAFNISRLISCGFRTVTVCSDLLKPGGYMRLKQYYTELIRNFKTAEAINIDDFIRKSSGKKNLNDAACSTLSEYASIVSDSKAYVRNYIKPPNIKSNRVLASFDCISAPCRDTCPANQDIPDYMYFTSKDQPEEALETILLTNPFPSVTGMVCDHLCQEKCTRINYDDPLLIREVKRFASGLERAKLVPPLKNGIRIAIVGAGPAGLTCAWYLALAGFETEVFEARSEAGGMVSFAIPGFRLTKEAIEKDLSEIKKAGVIIHYNCRIDRESWHTLNKDFDYIFVGAGAQLSAGLNIKGADSKGVIDSLDFLFAVREKKNTGIGTNVVIIGGGNSAMDAARTAFRLVGNDGKVTIAYRRTILEMPADQGEIKAVLEEGIEIIELVSPELIIAETGRVEGIVLSRMELQHADDGGRPVPVRIPGTEFRFNCDTIIPATGQNADLGFASGDLEKGEISFYRTRLGKSFIGGDALRGASTAINAIGDGRKAAEEIMKTAGIGFRNEKPAYSRDHTVRDLMIKRSERHFAPEISELPAGERKNFNLVSEPLAKENIIEEARRCLYCDEICNICSTVCPNFANYSFTSKPVRYALCKAIVNEEGKTGIIDDIVFEIKQHYQILNLANFCNSCGNCSTFCPTSGAPYLEKPRFYLTRSSFDAEEEGYYVDVAAGRRTLVYKNSEGMQTISVVNGNFIYETENIFSILDGEDFRLMEVKFKNSLATEARFERAAEMTILLKGSEKLIFS